MEASSVTIVPDHDVYNRSSDIVIHLGKPKGNTSLRDAGSVTLRLKVAFGSLAFPTAVKSAGWTGPRIIEDLARIGVVTRMSQADLDRLGMSPAWSSLLESLATLIRFGRRIPEVRSTVGQTH
jgi:hypothetical protein